MTKNESQYPTRNYIIAIFIIIIVLFGSWFGFRIYNMSKNAKISKSYLIEQKILKNEINTIDESIDVLAEAPASYFIFISYTGDEKVYNLEKDLAKIIQDYKLENQIYYLNITEIKDDKNVLEKINSALSLNDKKVAQIPTIIYYKDGIAVDIIKRQDDNMMNSGDFQKLLDVNKIEK